MNDAGWQKSQKMKKQIFPGHLDSLQNVDAKVEYQRYRTTGTLNKIHGTWSYEKMKKEKTLKIKIEDTLRNKIPNKDISNI